MPDLSKVTGILPDLADYLVYGAIAGWFGQVCTVYLGDASFASIYGEPFGTSQPKKLGNLPFTA